LFKRLKTYKKEYMRYEDGKIIPVQVEEKKLPNQPEPEIIPVKEALKMSVDTTIKTVGWKKIVKWIIGIAILLFFVFTLKDVYQSFFTSSEVDNELNIEQPTEGSTPVEPTNKNPIVESEEKENESVNEVPVVEEENFEGSNAFDEIVFITNKIDAFLYEYTQAELNTIQLYQNNKLNQRSIEQKFEQTSQNKEEILGYLMNQKDVFSENDFSKKYYDSLLKRVENSRNFSTQTYEKTNINSKDRDIDSLLQTYLVEEKRLKLVQTNSFIAYLDSKDIKYELNEGNQTISFQN